MRPVRGVTLENRADRDNLKLEPAEDFPCSPWAALARKRLPRVILFWAFRPSVTRPPSDGFHGRLVRRLTPGSESRGEEVVHFFVFHQAKLAQHRHLAGQFLDGQEFVDALQHAGVVAFLRVDLGERVADLRFVVPFELGSDSRRMRPPR